MARLGDGEPVDFKELGEIFAACGFQYHEPSFGTKVYYHPKYEDCGHFPARTWFDTLSPLQVAVVRSMVERALVKEQLGH